MVSLDFTHLALHPQGCLVILKTSPSFVFCSTNSPLHAKPVTWNKKCPRSGTTTQTIHSHIKETYFTKYRTNIKTIKQKLKIMDPSPQSGNPDPIGRAGRVKQKPETMRATSSDVSSSQQTATQFRSRKEILFWGPNKADLCRSVRFDHRCMKAPSFIFGQKAKGTDLACRQCKRSEDSSWYHISPVTSFDL